MRDRRPGAGTRRLAVVLPYYAPKIGGVETYAARIAQGFREREGYSVIVVTSCEPGRRILVDEVDGVKVFWLPRWVKLGNTPISPLWPWQLRRILEAEGVDLVNAHMPVPVMAGAAARAAGRRPVVLTYHAGSMLKDRGAANVLIRLYERTLLPRLLRRADAVVASSPSVETHVRPHAGDKTFLVTPGVDNALFAPAPAGVSADPAGEPPPTLLYAGRIEVSSAWKGIDVLIDAFSQVVRELPSARLVLVGEGDAVEQHRARVKALGLSGNVTFPGKLTGTALAERFQRATVVVLPSTTAAESFGMTLIEAMACGVPVVASNVGGIPFVVDDGRDGLLVPPADAGALAAACLRILRDPQLAAALGRSGHGKVTERYLWPGRIDSYAAIFETLLDHDSAAAGRVG